MNREKRNSLYLLLTIMSFLFSGMLESCRKDYEPVAFYDLKVTNKTDEAIYAIEYSFYDSTLLTAYHVFEVFPEGRLKKIPVGNSFLGRVASPTRTIKSSVETTYQVMIFRQSTLDRYSKEELVEKNIYDKLYVWTYDQWKSRNYQVDYTGD